MKGAEFSFCPTAIGYAPGQQERTGTANHDAWQVVQRGHAVANGCYLAAVKRAGYEEHPGGQGGFDSWGQSFVADRYGAVLAHAAAHEEEVLICPRDLRRSDQTRGRGRFVACHLAGRGSRHCPGSIAIAG